MIDWLARARLHFADSPGGGTDRTDETWLSSVSSVESRRGADSNGAFGAVSSVLSVASTPFGQKCCGPSPALLTPEQRNECHRGGWDDQEIETFIAREARFKARGRPDAEHLAERLTLRDRQRDDRRMCFECRELGPTGRCGAARRGELRGADRNLEPVQTMLMRCEGFR